MARSRNIKPGFFLNDDLPDVPPLGRILFAGLWTIADREGRLEDRPRRIKAEILPYDDCDVDELLEELCQLGFIHRYQVAEKSYILVINFKKHQNPHKNEAPFNLIPDSLKLMPDSFNPDSDTPQEKEIDNAIIKYKKGVSAMPQIMPITDLRNTYVKRYLLLCCIVFSLTGCANKIPEETLSEVAMINGAAITCEMVDEKIIDLLLQQDMQKINLELMKNEMDKSEKIAELILDAEQKLAVDITPNLAFNELVREIIKEQEAKKQGLTVSADEIERMIEESRKTEKLMDKNSEEYRIVKEQKQKLMDFKDLKTEKDYEDYLRGRMKKNFLIGELKWTIRQELAESLVQEQPELIGEKLLLAIEKRYQDYLEALLTNANIRIIDRNFSIEPQS